MPEDDNPATGFPTEQPEEGLAPATPELEAASQEEQPPVPEPSLYEQLRSKKNWATPDQMAQGYESVEAYARRLAAENQALQEQLTGGQVQEVDLENDPMGAIRQAIREEVGDVVKPMFDPLRSELNKGQLDKAETEVAEVLGDRFPALKTSPFYGQIRATAQNSPDPVATYQQLVGGLLQTFESLSTNPQTAFQAGVTQGQQTEQAKIASHILPGNSGAHIQPQPQTEAERILATAQRLREAGRL